MKGGKQDNPFGGCLVYTGEGLACGQPSRSLLMVQTDRCGPAWVPCCASHELRAPAKSRPSAPFIDLEDTFPAPAIGAIHEGPHPDRPGHGGNSGTHQGEDIDMHPKKPAPASRRDQNEKQRKEAEATPVLDLVDDDSGNAAVIAISVVVGIVVVFAGYNIAIQQRANATTTCEATYPVATQAAKNAKCNQDADNFVTFGGLGLLIAILVAGGLVAKKKGVI